MAVGTVKWFNADKGTALSPLNPATNLVHFSAIQSAGYRSIDKGRSSSST